MSSSSRRPPPRQVPPPTPTAGASQHARFIPREELTGYSTWSPGALDPAQVSAPGQRRKSQRLEEQASAARAAAKLKCEADQQAELGPPAVDIEALQQAARQSGYHDGYRDGLAALESFKRSFAQQMAGQIGQLLTSLDRELLGLEADMAQSLVHAATGLARQLIRGELSARPELIVEVARQAIAALSQSVRRIEMRVHPDDLALVQAGLGEEAAGRGVTCVADQGISRGGCTLHTELGSVDARIEHQWEQALRQIGQESTRWSLGQPDPL